ncbi:putative sialic acid-binding periplasmic protein SiaP [uncultured delta proteobacterium]|uniref:Putative sialic acid-binding periplasmic protein SiaP n=1 Tax=uncultured delta proteobacterium TaxID=34034 RepID=A0A212K2Z8_9DELT|nr:putative sialic acid-binding periplasmic protein SiaP [uncultured delta proteobacterium]
MKRILLCALAALLTLTFAATAFAATKLKFSHASPRTSTWHGGAEKFAEIIKEKTNGKFEIAIYPSDELSGGNQVAGIELVQTGVTDIHLHDALVWSAIAKEAIVPCFPWLLPTYADVDKYMQGPGGAALKQSLNKAGVVALAIGENGYRQVVNNRNPIRKPEDMKGLKMRVPGSSVHVTLLKYIGADPLTMNQSEVYTSLQQGTIDACENTLDLLVTQNTLEVTKFISFWNYSYDPLFLVVSQELWGSLSADEQKIFQAAADEAMAYQIKITREKEALLRKRMPEFKVAVVESLTPDEVAAFKKAVAKIYDDNEKQFGALFKEFGYSAK